MSEFPLDYDDWRAEWSVWLARHRELRPVRKAIPGKNFLADEILGTFKLPDDRSVELSELTFPNLSERDPQTGRLLQHELRAVGLTWVDDRRGTVVHSFAELEHELA
jgi:hypothetical protein